MDERLRIYPNIAGFRIPGNILGPYHSVEAVEHSGNICLTKTQSHRKRRLNRRLLANYPAIRPPWQHRRSQPAPGAAGPKIFPGVSSRAAMATARGCPPPGTQEPLPCHSRTPGDENPGEPSQPSICRVANGRTKINFGPIKTIPPNSPRRCSRSRAIPIALSFGHRTQFPRQQCPRPAPSHLRL